MKKYNTSTWQLKKTPSKVDHTTFDGNLEDQEVTNVNFTKINPDDLKNSDITLARIIELDENGEIDQYQYYFALQSFSEVKGHIENNKEDWERVLDRFNTKVEFEFEKNLNWKPEWGMMSTVCRAFSAIKSYHGLNIDKVKTASILLQRCFIRYKFPLETDHDRTKLFTAFYSFSTGESLCDHLQIEFIEDFKFKFVQHCNKYTFD